MKWVLDKSEKIEKENRGDLVTITSDFIPPYPVVVLAEDQLTLQKMQALDARRKPLVDNTGF